MNERTVQKLLILGELPTEYLRDWEITSDLDRARERMAVEIQEVSVRQVMNCYGGLSSVSLSAGEELASRLVSAAEGGDGGPDRDTVRRSARFYMTTRALLDEHGADALTVNCAVWKCSEDRPVPCVALMLLQERGVPAVCQADMDAFLAAVLFHRAGAWPTYIGGPHPEAKDVLDVSHCVLPRTMANRTGPPEPYYLADYHGSGRGCTVHTSIRRGSIVTVGRLTEGLDELLLGVGTVVGNAERDDRCRNTVLIRMEGAEELLGALKGHQQHLVVACGDHREAVADRARGRNINIRRV